MLFANFFYQLSRITYFCVFLLSGIVIILTILGCLEFYFDFDFPFIEISNKENDVPSGNTINVKIPIVDFRISFPPGWLIVLAFGICIFYTLYFYYLKEFFSIFIHEAFNKKSIKKLKLFAILIFLPVAYGLFFLLKDILFKHGIHIHLDDEYLILFIHLATAAICYLIIGLVKKVKTLEEETELTI